jgi:hypothetical protein
MPVYVEELQSKITLQDKQEQQKESASSKWEQLALYQGLRDRTMLDEKRTSAFGNED